MGKLSALEYKILEDSIEEIQKKLNQWRHKYILKILGTAPSSNRRLILILTRERI